MSGARFVRFYPSDWRSGCMGLSLEQEGFYIRLCSYVYETGQRLPSNDSAAAKFMGLHTNAYRKVKDQLVALGKVIARDDGWTVARAEKELSAARFASTGRQADQDAGRDTRPDTLGDTPQDTPIDTTLVSGVVFSETPNENNGPSLEPVAIANNQSKKDAKASLTSTDVLTAFELWNETALRCGLPQSRAMTPERRKKIGARLREVDGLAGWRQVLANIEKSSYLTGGNKDGWKADLKFLLRPDNFHKVHDGGYGNGRHAKAKVTYSVPQQQLDGKAKEDLLRQFGMEVPS